MTPEQIALVEQTVATVDLDAVAADFYRRAFALLGSLAAALGDGWTADHHEAWILAYNLTAEAMMLAAEARITPGRGPGVG